MGRVGSSLRLPTRGWVGCRQGQLLPGFPPAIRDHPLAGSVAWWQLRVVFCCYTICWGIAWHVGCSSLAHVTGSALQSTPHPPVLNISG